MRQPTRLTLLTAASLLAPSALHADIAFTASETLTTGNRIEDPPLAGLARQLTVSSSVQQITGLSITLDIASADADIAWNGDLYVHLSAPSGSLAVLLNRTGQQLSTDAGYGDAGFSITLDDTSPNHDIHSYQDVAYTLNGSGQLTGTWASDGRADPTSSTRGFTLSELLGENPNGIWTLLVSDQAGGNLAQLNGWSIQGLGIIPEPATWTALCATALLGFGAIHRFRRRP
jgi:subtilisin-like proprotein convertase family protein